MACTYCEDLIYDPQNPYDYHGISETGAYALIKNFNTTINNSNKYPYCGTIYGNSATINKLLNIDSAFKFHYCLEPKNLLYIAFEGDGCDFSTKPPTRTVNGVKTDCLSSADWNDTTGALPFGNANDLSTQQILSSSKTTLVLDRSQILAARDRFMGINPQNSKLPWRSGIYCDPEGYFDFASSIGAIITTAGTNFAGFRYYFGWDDIKESLNKLRVILVGIDPQGKNIPGTFKENSRPKILRLLNKPKRKAVKKKK